MGMKGLWVASKAVQKREIDGVVELLKTESMSEVGTRW